MFLPPARLHAAFLDLDDTLADTTGTLIPAALRAAATTMITAGLNADTEALGDFLTGRAAEARGGDYFADAVARFGDANGDTARLAACGRVAYLSADVDSIRLLPGVSRLLEALADTRRFLITAGNPATQRTKIERLGLSRTFDEIRCVDTLRGDDKRASMRELLVAGDLDPSRCLCIGDRVASDIRLGNELGMVTVWVRRGEFHRMEPRRAAERPDHIVSGPAELLAMLHRGRAP